MSARIAPEPIIAPMAAAIGSRMHASVSEQSIAPASEPSREQDNQPRPAPTPLPPLPAPPDPPGTMFAAAVMAGALSPKPETPQEIFLRIGRDWSPPDSELHLADRLI